MNTRSINWTSTATAKDRKVWNASETIGQATRHSSRVLGAATPALAIVVAAAWAIDSVAAGPILQAILWSTGFIFLALAIETNKAFGTLVVSGLAITGLAVLSEYVALEFAVAAAAIIAGWVFASILKLSR